MGKSKQNKNPKTNEKKISNTKINSKISELHSHVIK